MPVAAPVAAALIMAAATVGTAVVQHQMRPGAPKIPKAPMPLAPPKPKLIPEAASDVQDEADKEAKRAAAATMARQRAAARLSSGIRTPTGNPLGTVSHLGQ